MSIHCVCCIGSFEQDEKVIIQTMSRYTEKQTLRYYIEGYMKNKLPVIEDNEIEYSFLPMTDIIHIEKDPDFKIEENIVICYSVFCKTCFNILVEAEVSDRVYIINSEHLSFDAFMTYEDFRGSKTMDG